QVGRVHRDVAVEAVREMRRAASPDDRDVLARHGKDGGAPEGDDELRLDQLQLLLEPPAVMLDLAGRRLLVDALLAALLELEVLHRVRNVHFLALQARILERAVEEASGWPNEGAPGQLLLVARLLAD